MSRSVCTAFLTTLAALATLAAPAAHAALAGGPLRAGPSPGDGFADASAVRVALVKAFGGDSGLTVSARPVMLDSSDRARVRAHSASPFADDTLRIFACGRGGAIAGYGLLDNVRGKSRDITYLVAVDTLGAIVAVEILVYRESHGGEISAPGFRDQFRGKKPGDPLTPGRDIRTISGATISSRSVTAGVAKLLAAFGLVRERI